MRLDPETPVSSLKGVGSATTRQLKKLGIEKAYDLILHYPYRYLDFSQIKKISDAKIGEPLTVKGKIKNISLKRFKGRKSLLEVYIFDGTGYLTGCWFNQPFLQKSFKKDELVAFSGTPEFRYGKLQIVNPLYEFKNSIETGNIIPVYPLTANLQPKKLRSLVRQALELLEFKEFLPANIVNRFQLIDRSSALRSIHFPVNLTEAKEARKRLKIEELFLLQTALLNEKRKIKNMSCRSFIKKEELTNKVLVNLGYRLTADQEKAFSEIRNDLLKSTPMNRLLQGEVGSGKTTVALLSMLLTVENGLQACLMAPTEILAMQHFLTFKELLKDFSLNTALLTGSLAEKEKVKLRKNIKKGDVDLIIGTHSLIQKETSFKDLGLAIIDEQHRFGVAQRSYLQDTYANTLVMTATPIPRTLALTCYSDLDISTLKELPGNRSISDNIQTLIVKDDKRQKAYEKIKMEISKGRQAYIICPLIEESDKLQLKAVMDEADYLKNIVFKDYTVAILHGRLKNEEKERVMESFKRGKSNILISTTVVEVGIDVGNATVMLIENAERFGLSQLHQLRGRIGRSHFQSYCIVFADLKTDETKNRMKAFKEYADGFDLAEADLEIRGEGEIAGFRQSGFSDLRLTMLSRDLQLIKEVKAEALKYLSKNSLSGKLLKEIKIRFPAIGKAGCS